jgi:zinc transport system substrate-binding protein
MRTILTLGLVLALAGCGGTEDPDDSADRISVVTSFYPLTFAAERIGGDCVEVTDLTPPGVEPHDLELTPDGVAAVASADLVLYVGGGFQPAVEDALGEAEGATVDLLQALSTIPNAEEEEDAPAVDPHVWLDPIRFATIASEIEGAFDAGGVPASCEVADRASELRDELEAIDVRYQEGLADCALDVFVTSHAAFGYLADAYGLRQEAIAGLEPDTEPNPARLAEIADLVRREGVSVIFTEELVPPDVADTIARETGARTEVLATIEGLTDEERSAGEDYLSLMEGNLDALRGALDCA